MLNDLDNFMDEDNPNNVENKEQAAETEKSPEKDPEKSSEKSSEKSPEKKLDEDVMEGVEIVATREINTQQVEEELAKTRKKRAEKKSEAPDPSLRPEERRELRRQKRKHARNLAAVWTIVIAVILIVATIFGTKYFLGKADDNDVATQIPEPEPIVEQAPVVDFTPELEPATVTEPVDEPEPEPEPEMTEEELFDEMLDTMIAEMPLEDKVAGLFMITPEALTAQGTVTKAGDGTKAALEKYAVGGIIYFKQNITSADQVKEMIDNTNSFSKYPLFIAVDEEGGDVARVQAGLKLDKTPTAKELGEKDNTIDTYDTYNTIGKYLTEYGFNVDFAPVADVLTNENNNAIGNRSFSSDPDVVTRMIPSAVNGLQDAGVSACLKHFPGQGNVDADTHETLAITQKTKAEMTECELKSFAAGIEADVDMIMVGHFSAPELTGDNTPCSISKDVITGLLREEMGYDGIVITDAMNMSAISEYYSADEAAIKAIKAGADIVLMPEDFELAYNGVIDAVKDGTIDEQRINDCLKRIYRVKYAGTLNENE